MKKIIVFLGLLCIFTKCNSKPSVITTKIDPLSIDQTIIGNSYKLEGVELLRPRQIVNIQDKFLVIFDNVGEGIFKVFSLPNLEYLYSWGQEGKGPNEFSFITFNFLDTERDNLVLYEPSLSRLRYYSIGVGELKFSNEKILPRIPYSGPLNSLTRVSDSLYIAVNEIKSVPDNEYVGFDINNSKKDVFYFGNFPDSEILDLVDKNHSFSKVLAIQPEGDKIAFFYRNYNSFGIYDFGSDEMLRFKIEEKTYKEDLIYRIHAQATEDFVITLALYKTPLELSEMNPNDFEPIIEVWNWNGEPVSKFYVNKPIHKFTISNDGSHLYGFSVASSDEIYMFDISQVY